MEHVERLKAALADRYLIEREIGSGGMDTVYLAMLLWAMVPLLDGVHQVVTSFSQRGLLGMLIGPVSRS